MAYCEYMHEPKYGMCGLSDKYGERMRCENIKSDVCEKMRAAAREEEGGGEMTDTEILEWLMDSGAPERVKQRCVGMLRAQRYGKVSEYKGQDYCECGYPVDEEYTYCADCGAKLVRG